MPANRVLCFCLSLVLSFTAAIAPPAQPPTPQANEAPIANPLPHGMQLLSHLGGNATAVVYSAGMIYLAVGPDLVILDANDPANIHVVSRLFMGTTNTIKTLAASGSLVFVVVGNPTEVNVVDVSLPVSPLRVGTTNLGGNILEVAAQGNYLYIADQTAGLLRILNTSDPAHLVQVGSLPGFAANDLDINGAYLYGAFYYDGLKIANIANPSSPGLVGSLDTPDAAVGIAVDGSYAYVADTETMRIINVSVPSAPVEEGVFSLPYPNEAGTFIDAEGSTVYMGNCYAVRQIDVSQKSQPQEISSLFPACANHVVVNGNLLLISDGIKGLIAYSINSSGGMAFISSVPTDPSSTTAIAAQGNYAYLGVTNVGLVVYDVSNPALPTKVRSLNLPGQTSDVVLANSYAYVANTSGNIHVVDIQNPGDPVLVYTTPASPNVNRLILSGGYLYTSGQGVSIFSLANPAQPKEIGQIAIPFNNDVFNFMVVGNYVYGYVGVQATNILILDFSTPTVPVQVGSLSLPNPSFAGSAMTTYGNLAYIAIGNRLNILDTTDPSSPVLMSSAAMESTYSLMIHNGILYDRMGGGLRLYSLHSPLSPMDMGSVSGFHWSDLFCFDGDTLYVAKSDALHVYDVSSPSEFVFRGQFEQTQATSDLAAEPGVLYSLDVIYPSQAVLQVWDIHQPEKPAPISWLKLNDGCTNDLEIAGHYLYAACGDYGLLIIDVSDPLHPEIRGHADTPGWATRVRVSGTMAYLADWSGLAIVDVSNPSAPLYKSSLALTGTANCVDASGNYAFVCVFGSWRGDFNYGFQVVDVSDPQHPFIAHSYLYWGAGAIHRELAVSGRTVYLTGGGLADFGGVTTLDLVIKYIEANRVFTSEHHLLTIAGVVDVYDISSLIGPYKFASWTTSTSFNNLAASGDQVFVTDGSIYILQLDPFTLNLNFLPKMAR